jgi:hypothetical protein
MHISKIPKPIPQRNIVNVPIALKNALEVGRWLARGKDLRGTYGVGAF